MKRMDYSLLKEVQNLYKNAYVPPPSPEPATQQQDPNQIMQIVQQGISEGVPPEQIFNDLAQKGVPQELLQQIFQSLPAQEEKATPPPPPNIREVVDSQVEEERKKLKQQSLSLDERIFIVEKKIDSLMNIIQDMVGSLPPKEGMDREYLQSVLDGAKDGYTK